MTAVARRPRLIDRFVRLPLPAKIALAASLLGFALRLEHGLTFNGLLRGSDYAVHMQGVRWTLEHLRPMNFDPTAHYQVNFYPPLYYFTAGAILKLTGSEQAIALLGVTAWVVRQALLAKILAELAPRAHWARAAALSIHAVLPLSILVDGKVNPEGLHSGLYMLAFYALFRMERQAVETGRIRWRTGALFGILTGITMLTKATALVLVLGAALTFGWRFVCAWLRTGVRRAFRLVFRPALAAAFTFCAVTGWWCGPNLVKYGHPAPHVWDTEGPQQHSELAVPALDRRSFGWTLPFEWKEVLEFPLVRSPWEPRPNFWAGVVTGTWSDYYNRGFCRLKGGEVTDRVWGGLGGWMPTSDLFSVTYRCVRLYQKLLYVGLFLTLVTVAAVFYTLWAEVRTLGRRGFMTIPLVTMLGTFFVMLFALVYPLDNYAVLNPRYILPQVALMSACLGILLARFEELRARRGVAGGFAAVTMVATYVAIAGVAGLVLYERFGV